MALPSSTTFPTSQIKHSHFPHKSGKYSPCAKSSLRLFLWLGFDWNMATLTDYTVSVSAFTLHQPSWLAGRETVRVNFLTAGHHTWHDWRKERFNLAPSSSPRSTGFEAEISWHKGMVEQSCVVCGTGKPNKERMPRWKGRGTRHRPQGDTSVTYPVTPRLMLYRPQGRSSQKFTVPQRLCGQQSLNYLLLGLLLKKFVNIWCSTYPEF